MKKFIYLFIFVFISIAFMTEVQIAKKRYYKPIKNQRLVVKRANTAPFFSQGNLFITSNSNRVLVHFILRNNNSNGRVISGADVFVNNFKINGTRTPGEYKGLAPLNRNQLGQYPLNVRIVTPNKRVLTANGIVDAVIKMEIDTIFPRQPNKIDVGGPSKINWYFIPNRRKPVTLSIVNTGNGVTILRRVFRKNRVRIPVNLIPRRKTVRIKVAVPPIYLRYNQGTNKDSILKIHVKDEKVLHTFG